MGIWAIICGLRTKEAFFNIVEVKQLIRITKDWLKDTTSQQERKQIVKYCELRIRNIIRDSLIRLGRHKEADDVYVMQMSLRRKIAKVERQWKDYILLTCYSLGNRYNRNFALVIFWFIVFAFFFGVAYYKLGLLSYAHKEGSLNFLDCLYFSLIAFTTVGFGDIYPHAILGKFFVSIQAVVFISFLIIMTFMASHNVARKSPISYPKWEDLNYDQYFES